MTVFERLKSMTADELQSFILTIYQWGHANERCGTNDSFYYKHLMSYDQSCIDDIINDYDKYGKHLHKLKVSDHDGSNSRYLSTRFFSVEDADEYIRDKVHGYDSYGMPIHAVRITTHTYEFGSKILTIEEE